MEDIDKDKVLAQWQTCVEMANEVSDRRDTTNNLFATLNLGIIATISIIWDIKTFLLAVAGIVICSFWIVFINNYKALNKAKFEVILKLEKELPIKPFDDEWNFVKNNKKYIESTKLEKVFPVIFMILYIIIISIVFIFEILKIGGC